MAKLLALPFALSLDSLIVSISLGTLGLGRTTKRNLVFLFALCDGIASLAGSMLAGRWLAGFSVLFRTFEVSALSLYALLIVALGSYARSAVRRQRGLNWFYVFPFALCLDNFVTGLSYNSGKVPISLLAVVVGIAGALMSLAGLRVGSMLREHLPIRVATLAGAGLLGLVAAMALC